MKSGGPRPTPARSSWRADNVPSPRAEQAAALSIFHGDRDTTLPDGAAISEMWA